MTDKKQILLSLHEASVIYPTETHQGLQVWSGITLHVARGEWITVTGPNGSGKSTLGEVLLGLCPLSSGELHRPAGVEVRGVLQSPESQFIGERIEDEFEHIFDAPGLTSEELHRLQREALRRVGLALDPRLRLDELSGGQQQLVNIAAALASGANVLLLDEPTAMLDPAVREQVLEAVRRVHLQGTTIVWITHRLEEAVPATRVIAFGEGAVVYDGPPHAFFYGTEAGRGDNEDVTSPSPCERLGMEPPFTIRTARLLQQRGCPLGILPLSPEELAEAVARLCR